MGFSVPLEQMRLDLVLCLAGRAVCMATTFTAFANQEQMAREGF